MTGPSKAETAQTLLERGNVAQAVALVDQATAAGDINTAFMSAIWRMVGQPTPRDLPRARADLKIAMDGGHPDAPLMLVALTANGSGAPPDWPAALTLLDTAASSSAAAAQQLDLIKSMQLTEDGDPVSLPAVDWISRDPPIQVFRNALTPEERSHVAQSVTDIIAPSIVVDSAGRQIRHPIRNSDGAVIGPTRETLAIGAINRRIAAMTRTRVEQGEPIQVLRYGPGQQYRLHLDALPNADNQRILTAITYLNDDFTGGETDFPELAVRIVPRAGDTLVFANMLPNGQSDPRTRHAGLPVTRGVKWIATRWIRAAPFSPWQVGGG